MGLHSISAKEQHSFREVTKQRKNTKWHNNDKLREDKYKEETNERQRLVSKVCYKDSSGFLSLDDRGLEFSLVVNFCHSLQKGKGGTFTNVCPAFTQIGEGQRAFLVCFLSTAKYSINQSGICVGSMFCYSSASRQSQTT